MCPFIHPPHADLEGYRIQAEFCRIMGHPIRLQILNALHQAQGELPSADLLALTQIPKPSLSQHLSKMQACGLVTTRRAGRFLHVKLACPEIGQACAQVRLALNSSYQSRAAQLGDTSQPKSEDPTWAEAS
jgi:DNA-binding transcriptional ArsR family regulator